VETPQRIEPARLEETSEVIADAIADLSAASARLGHGLHPRTSANLADLVRLMNTYYSNLIEGHHTGIEYRSAECVPCRNWRV
jgi:Fic family protein